MDGTNNYRKQEKERDRQATWAGFFPVVGSEHSSQCPSTSAGASFPVITTHTPTMGCNCRTVQQWAENVVRCGAADSLSLQGMPYFELAEPRSTGFQAPCSILFLMSGEVPLERASPSEVVRWDPPKYTIYSRQNP